MRTLTVALSCLLIGSMTAGCSGNKELLAQRNQEITDLQADLDLLEKNLAAEKDRSEQLHGDLEKALADLEEKDRLFLEREKELSTITIPDAVTFASSSTRLTEEGKEILDRIWGVLSEYPDHLVMVEGHTDDVQIAEQFKGRYASNWELSSARAHAVVHYVVKKHNADPKRLSAIGYGEYQPVADNETPEGRALNRRVVIAVRAAR